MNTINIDKNNQDKLHPEIEKLIKSVTEQIQKNQDNNEVLDVHEYRTKCYEIEKAILIEEINADYRSSQSLKTLANLTGNISRYNELLHTNYDNDTPFTWGRYVQILNDNVIGLKTGFKALDKYVTIQPASLVFIAGRPSHGKTTMMLNMLRNMIITNPDKAFLFYSYEEEEKTILSKIILAHTEFNDSTKNELKRKYGDKSYLEIIELEIKMYEATSEMNHSICKAKQEIEEWLSDKRLQILNKKPSVESLSSAIIERCVSVKKNNKQDHTNKDVGKVAAVFIDYVQKLSTEEERVNRQQEIQRICSILLSATQDSRVRAAFILGSQVNRDAKSSDTFNLHNMKDAGDIEQDANLVLGVWNPLAEKMQMLQSVIDKAQQKLDMHEIFSKDDNNIDLSILMTINNKSSDNEKSNNLLNNKKELQSAITQAKERLKNLAKNNDQKLAIKILKNRNGRKDLEVELQTILNQFLVKDTPKKTEKD